MKTLLVLIFAGLAMFAQTNARVAITKADGTQWVANAKGADAEALIEVIEKYLATQTECVQVAGTPAVIDGQGNVTKEAVAPSQNCTPRHVNPAAFGLRMILDFAESQSDKFPPTSDKVAADKIAADIAALEAKRKKRTADALK